MHLQQANYSSLYIKIAHLRSFTKLISIIDMYVTHNIYIVHSVYVPGAAANNYRQIVAKINGIICIVWDFMYENSRKHAKMQSWKTVECDLKPFY